MTVHELAATAAKCRAAQRLARRPATYATMREQATAVGCEQALDAALEEIARTPDVRAATSVEEVPE